MKAGLFLIVGVLALKTGISPAAIHYVDINSSNPTPPFTNWVTAANTIQDAVDVADVGDTVLVTNGIYRTGGRTVSGALTNRVAVTKAITLQSVNGPEMTVIQGYKVPGTTNNGCGDSAVRCMYLTNGASLIGFTLTNGATRTSGEISGGGILCASTNVSVSNCIMSSNSSFNGGGAYSGTFDHCTFADNISRWGGGGAYGATLRNCTLTGNSVLTYAYIPGQGGGAFWCTLNNCTLAGNSAQYGGGANGSVLNNCLLTGNSAYFGGGASTYMGGIIRECTLTNCSLVENSAANSAGGAYECFLNNCIVYFNTSPTNSNYEIIWPGPWPHLNNSCATPLPPDGVGNITSEPAFIDLANGNYHLQSNSRCINSGNNAYVFGATDLDGNPRIVNGTVDIGAYEFQPPDTFHGWLLSYGLPGNGTADYIDSDGDGADNWQEWRSGTIPTNALSVLRMLPPTFNASGVTVIWQSVTNRTYYLQSATNVSQSFPTLRSNIVGQANTTSVVDTNSIGSAPRFYRVGVE